MSDLEFIQLKNNDLWLDLRLRRKEQITTITTLYPKVGGDYL
jgi:hypothetical protein